MGTAPEAPPSGFREVLGLLGELTTQGLHVPKTHRTGASLTWGFWKAGPLIERDPEHMKHILATQQPMVEPKRSEGVGPG